MENNHNIFKILNPNDNTMLTSLSKDELDIVINYLNEYYLELRKSIGNYPNDTAGFEFEFEDYDENLIRREMIKNNYFDEGYKLYEDGEDCYYYVIGEVCTPVLNVSNINWNRIKDLCYIIKRNGYIGNNCGGHIHIGAQILENKKKILTNFAALIIAYENILARFFYGNFINERLVMHAYAPPVASDWYDEYRHFKSEYYLQYSCRDIINKLSGHYTKNQFINLSNIKDLEKIITYNTFEYRGPNGTLDPIIWQNNLNVIVKLMHYCNRLDFNSELIEKRIEKNVMHLNDYKFYRQIEIDAATEFCDLIFDNNLDKIYFLRQYLKDKKITDSKVLVLSKKFTETSYNDNDIV